MALTKRKFRQTVIVGQERINQIEHLEEMGARAVTPPINSVGKVITTDTSAAGVLVGKVGTVLRIEATAGTYIAFGEEAMIAVTAATTPGFKHPGGFVLLNATDKYIRSSAALTRLEIINPSDKYV